MGGRARLLIVSIGCVLLIAGLALTLTRAVPVRTGTNDTLATNVLGGSAGRLDVCQDAELIPAHTGAIRVSLATVGQPGPALTIVATDGRTTIGRGTLTAGWHGEAATIPLRPVTHAPRPARICVFIGASATVIVDGEAHVDPRAGASATAGGAELGGRLRFEYLTRERRTWWSQVGVFATRMGFGRAFGGDGVAYAVALLMLCAASLGLWQLVRAEG